MGGRTITVALACGRPTLRGAWRQVLTLALLAGLLGGVALGAVAGARRTAAAYGRYLAAINASDVSVNVPGRMPGMPATRPYELISALPGVVAHAAYIGLSGVPLVHGKRDNSFLVNSLNGSLDGEYFSQDRATVLAGRLPAQDSTSTVVLTPAIAKAFGTGVGGTVSYLFQPVDAQQQPVGQPFARSFRVAAIVEVPPALVDESDEAEGSIFPPGATRQLLPEYFYTWIGLRLAQGTAGTGELQRHLAALAEDLQRQARQAVHRDVPPPLFTVNRTDVIRGRVQQAIRPEAVALTVFGAIAALAILVLVGQGLAQMISRSAPDTAVLRGLGATRAQAALAAAWPGVIAVLGGLALAVAGAGAVSPLAPVGPVRRYDPDHGIAVDGLVLGAGAAMLALALLGLLAVLAIRSVRPRDSGAGVGSSAAARAAAAAGLPAVAVVGTRNALEPGSGVRAVPVRSALLGSIAAVTAVVFSASLSGLAAHPARYGWNWDLVIQAESGYGAFTPGVMKKLIRDEPAVAGWSEFGFAQLPVDGKVVPALGLRRDLGSVQPPTTSGHALSGAEQIELGTVTLRELGKEIGDRVRIGIAPYTRTVVITGTVTLPSFGVGAADHPGLGHGAMVPQATLQAAMGQAPGSARPSASRFPYFRQRWRSIWPPAPPGRSGPPWSAGSFRPTRTGLRAAATSRGGGTVADADRAEPGPAAAPRARSAQGAGHDARPGQGGHRLADHVDAADRRRDRRAAGHRLRTAGLACLRRFARGGADRRGPGGRAHPRPGRAGAGGQPAGGAARGRGRANPARRQPEDRVASPRRRGRSPR
jgi:hypothetical protein